MLFLLCMVYIVVPGLAVVDSEEIKQHNTPIREYCVVGAGPGGLQIGYFLQKAGRDYIIFEKGTRAGTFFTKFPIHRKLISINKRHTGKSNKEFNIRHDWNSLLSADESLRFTKYSKDFFPSADVAVKYFNDFATKLRLKIMYGTTITNITKTNSIFFMGDHQDKTFTCKYVIIATGISKPNKPHFKGEEFVTGYEDLNLELDEYVGKNVLILGHGNSAFEVAEHIMPVTKSIHMMARSPITMAWATHYVGDLRAVNLAFVGTATQNTLDTVISGSVEYFSVSKNELNGKLYLHKQMTSNESLFSNNNHHWVGIGYDKIIRCLGFNFDDSIFNEDMRLSRNQNAKKYPLIDSSYESKDVENLYFVGANTHSLDFKKSAGAFIHGYRYTARTLHRLLEWKLHGNKWPYIHFDNLIDLTSHLAKRFNEASDLYQMFGVLCDVVIYNVGKSKAVYLEAFPCALASELSLSTGHDVSGPVMFMSMEYGKETNFPQQFKRLPHQAYRSYFLHPILYHYDNLVTHKAYQSRPERWILPVPDYHLHVVEDFLTKFNHPTIHLLSLRRFIETSTGQDIRFFFAKHCLVLSLTMSKQPIGCNHSSAAKPTSLQLLTLNTRLAEQLAQMKGYLLPFQVMRNQNLI